MDALSLDDDEPSALALDDEQPAEKLAYVVRLHPDSPYVKMPAFLLQGKVVQTSELMDIEDHYFKVTNVTDFDANLPGLNPGPAYREITVVEVEG